MLAKETWLDGEQALELGFIDRIADSSETLNIAASLDKASWIMRKPDLTKNRAQVIDKINDFEKQIAKVLAR